MKIHNLLQRILLSCFVIVLCAVPAPVVGAQSQTPELQEKTPATPSWPPRPDPILAEPLDQANNGISIPSQCTGPEQQAGGYIRIVYMSYQDVKWEIYLRNICPTPGIQRLTDNSAFDGYPRLDKQRSRIVFVSDRNGNDELYTMGLAGEDVHRLTMSSGTDTYPAWSPDGQRIVFVSDRGGDPDLYTMNRDGSNQQLLAHLAGLDSDPSWSLDGNSIVWVHWSSTSMGGVYQLDLATRAITIRTQNLHAPSRPTLSPDGKNLELSADVDGDGWVDFAWVALNNGILSWRSCIHQMVFGRCDFILGGIWLEGNRGLGSAVSYVQNGSTWYVSFAELVLVEPDINPTTIISFQNSVLDFYPDVSSSDLVAPVSRVLPLPEFSPSRDFHVQVTANDQGEGGLATVNLSGKSGSNPIWDSFGSVNFPDTGPSSASIDFGPFMGVPGETLSFRSSSSDHAEHAESVHPNADASTRLYSWTAQSQIIDQRNNPVGAVQANITPGAMNQPVSDANGALTAYLSADGPYNATFTHPGYTGPPALRLQSQQGTNLTFFNVLPTGQNILQNGQFEDAGGALTGWQSGETLPAAQGEGHTGMMGVRLGPACAASVCFAPEENIPDPDLSIPTTALTPDGVINLVYARAYSENVYYTNRDAAGQWSTPVIVVNDPNPGISRPHISDLAMDHAGNLAFIYKYDGFPLTLMRKPLGGAWTSEIVGADAPHYFVLRADGGGRLHVLYADPIGRLFYSVRGLGGAWEKPFLIYESSDIHNFDLAPADDGTVHIGYFRYNGRVFDYVQIKANGELSVPEQVDDASFHNSDYGIPLRMIAGEDGKVHVLVTTLSNLYFARDASAGWSKPLALLNAVPGFTARKFSAAGMDGDGNLHIYFTDQGASSRTLFELILWSGNTTFVARMLAVDGPYQYSYPEYRPLLAPDGALHLVMAGEKDTYQREHTVAQIQSGSISQVLAIPANINKPTLSLLYKWWHYYADGQSGLDVELTPQNGSPVGLLSLHEPGDWKHAWADLTPWQGQTVTLTFRLRQAAGETSALAALDEIVVSAWTTLSVNSFEVSCPQPVLNWWSAPVTVTVHGANFAEGILVRLGGQEIPSTRLNENELTFILPASFMPGMYLLELENPGGIKAIAPGRIKLGNYLYIPELHK